MKKLLILLALLLVSTTGQAQTRVEPRGGAASKALAALNAEQQALHRQFQILQSLRDASAVPPPQQPGPPRNYDEVVKERQAALEQTKRYQSEMDALYARYTRLEEEKQPLLAQLRDLALEPPPPVPTLSANPPSSSHPR